MYVYVHANKKRQVGHNLLFFSVPKPAARDSFEDCAAYNSLASHNTKPSSSNFPFSEVPALVAHLFVEVPDNHLSYMIFSRNEDRVRFIQ